ncbi:MAG: hypothetical protein U0W24_06235 [Bacteroidales bacterium]
MLFNDLFTLLMLVILQAVLSIDNLLYISMESKHAPENRRKYVRKMGIGVAILLRVGLLFLLTSLIKMFEQPFISFHFDGIISAGINVHSLIVYFGGGFILYTSIKEIWHMISLEEQQKLVVKKPDSVVKLIFLIVLMNLVFSFDSILSAIALTDNILLMSIAVVVGGILMIWLAEKVSAFLQKNRMFEVLGLFILFLVGVMLLTDAGHLSHLTLFDTPVERMNQTTFYFIIVILILIDLVQSRYHKKLLKIKEKKTGEI